MFQCSGTSVYRRRGSEVRCRFSRPSSSGRASCSTRRPHPRSCSVCRGTTITLNRRRTSRPCTRRCPSGWWPRPTDSGRPRPPPLKQYRPNRTAHRPRVRPAVAPRPCLRPRNSSKPASLPEKKVTGHPQTRTPTSAAGRVLHPPLSVRKTFPVSGSRMGVTCKFD